MSDLARTHVIVDEEGVMLDVVTGVEPPYVVLVATHLPDRPGAVFGLDAPAARRLAERLIAAADDSPEFDPARPATYPCATGRDCGCDGTGRAGCPGRET